MTRYPGVCRRFAVLVAGVFLLGGPGALQAQVEERSAPRSIEDVPPELVEEITQAVLRELLDEGLLDEQVDRGIQRYVRKRQAEQATARSSRDRAAQEKAKSVRKASVELDHIRGDPEAVVSLIEYSDFECPFCKRFHRTAQQLLELYDGRVNWVYRHFPLRSHMPGAQQQAEGAECAAELGGNEAFWSFTDAVYERTRSGGQGFRHDALVPLAEEIGLESEAFSECLESGRHSGRVKRDLLEGQRAGITGTPGNLLINNETGEVRAVSGAVPLGTLRQVIDAMLAKPSS